MLEKHLLEHMCSTGAQYLLILWSSDPYFGYRLCSRQY